MLQEYVPPLMLIGFVIANTIVILVVSHYLLHARPTPVKQVANESGMPPLGHPRDRFGAKFYLIAMLFIVLGIETVFMIQGGFEFLQLGLLGLIEMVVFVAILQVGYLHAGSWGALEWD